MDVVDDLTNDEELPNGIIQSNDDLLDNDCGQKQQQENPDRVPITTMTFNDNNDDNNEFALETSESSNNLINEPKLCATTTTTITTTGKPLTS